MRRNRQSPDIQADESGRNDSDPAERPFIACSGHFRSRSVPHGRRANAPTFPVHENFRLFSGIGCNGSRVIGHPPIPVVPFRKTMREQSRRRPDGTFHAHRNRFSGSRLAVAFRNRHPPTRTERVNRTVPANRAIGPSPVSWRIRHQTGFPACRRYGSIERQGTARRLQNGSPFNGL